MARDAEELKVKEAKTISRTLRKRINIDEMREYSSLNTYIVEDVLSSNGAVLIPKGTELASLIKYAANLCNTLHRSGIESIAVAVNDQFEVEALENIIKYSEFGITKMDSKFARDTVEQIKDVYSRIADGICEQKNVSNLVDQGKELAKIVNKTPEIMFCLGHVRENDEYTYVHSLNVALISGFLANKLFPEDKNMVSCLSIGGILHDLGKAKVPNGILNKPGALSDPEFETMKKHTIYGEELAKEYGVHDPRILSVIRGHHERYGGNGYPDILSGDKISIEARIAAVTDVFDALTARRVYKEPMDGRDAIIMMIDKMSVHFDPVVLRTLILSVGLFPPGTTVELSDGSFGVVVGTNGKDLIRPQVMIIIDKSFKKLEEVLIVDLSKNNESIFIKQAVHDLGKIGF